LRLFDAHMSGQARSACLASLCADLPNYDGAKDDDQGLAACLSQQTPIPGVHLNISSLRDVLLHCLRPIEFPTVVLSHRLVIITALRP
jgi:hypothetical protein